MVGVRRVNLVERYVHEILRHIPITQKDDIEKEVRSLIDDLLQEQVKLRTGAAEISPERVSKPSEDDIRQVLTNLGDPAELAGKYRGSSKHVIGPMLYDTYWLVLKIVLIAVGLGLILAKSIQVITDRQMGAWEIISSYLNIYQSLLSAFAMVTLIFIGIEHFGGEDLSAELKTEKRAWKPDTLPNLPSDKLRIRRGDPVASIIFTLIFIAILNVFPQLFGFYQQTEEGINLIGFLGQGFRTYLIWINLVLLLGIVLEAIKIAYGRWTFFLILTGLAQNIMSLIVGLLVIRHPAFISPDFVLAVNDFLAANDVSVTVLWQNHLVTAFTVLLIFGFVLETITLAAKGVRLMQEQLSG